MMGNFDDVKAFHEKFGLPARTIPTSLSQEEFSFRASFIREELEELREAHWEEDLVKEVDALLDLVYVALGTAVMMGVPWEACWRHVQEANMLKVRGGSHRSDIDVVKPDAWVSPHARIEEELQNAGWVKGEGI